jgi:hypothetical protein
MIIAKHLACPLDLLKKGGLGFSCATYRPHAGERGMEMKRRTFLRGAYPTTACEPEE